LEKRYKGRENEEEDVSSYIITLKKEEDAGNRKRNCWIIIVYSIRFGIEQ